MAKRIELKREVKQKEEFEMVGAGKGSVNVGKVSLPPTLNTTPVFSQIIRFRVATILTSQSITAAGIAASLGGIALTTTTFSPWTSAFRIKKIRVWPPVVSGADKIEVVFTSQSTNFEKDSAKDGIIPDGVSTTTCRTFKPPKRSLLEFWLNSGLGTLQILALSMPAGTIIDLHADCTMSNTIAQFATQTVAGATAGNTYWRPLDGAGGVVTVVSRPSL